MVKVIVVVLVLCGLYIWRTYPRQCPACKGFGELPPNGEMGYMDCPCCKGSGRMA